MKKTNKKIRLNFRSLKLIMALAVTNSFINTTVYAQGGNAITESTIFKGAAKMLTDAGVAALIIVPSLALILIIFYSAAQGASPETHDKEKWKKNRNSVLFVLAWIFGASALITIISSYFQ